MDTGATVTIMSSNNFQHHFPNETISNSTLQPMTYTKDKLTMSGEMRVLVSYNNQGSEFTQEKLPIHMVSDNALSGTI